MTTARPCPYCLAPTTLGICRHCAHIQSLPVTSEHALPPGDWVLRGNRRVFVARNVEHVKRTKPFAPGLTCVLCLGDPYTGCARRTDDGWRHADASDCVRVLAAGRAVA